MQSKSFTNFHNTKLKARKIVFTIWDGPGKFFIVIFISMFIVGIHESMKSLKNDSKFHRSSFSSNSNFFTMNFKENKIDMVQIIKKNQNKVQNQQEEEDLNVLLEMANQQMESERRRLTARLEYINETRRDYNPNYEETFQNNQDKEILEEIFKNDAIYINV